MNSSNSIGSPVRKPRKLCISLGLRLLICGFFLFPFSARSLAQISLGIQAGTEFPLLLNHGLDGYFHSLGTNSLGTELRYRSSRSDWMPRFQAQYGRIQVPLAQFPPLVAVIHYHRLDLRLALSRESQWKKTLLFYGGGLGASYLRSRHYSFDRNTGDAYHVIGEQTETWVPHLHLLAGIGSPIKPGSRWNLEAGIHMNYGLMLDGAQPIRMRITHPGGQSHLSSATPHGHLIQPGIFLALQYALNGTFSGGRRF